MKKKQNLDLNYLIPSSLKNETLSSLVANLFNRFVSDERTLNKNGRIGRQVAGDAEIRQSNLERELNALIPALYYKTGSEENIFVFEDLIDRLKILNVDTDNLKKSLAEQSFNFSLPIDYDKFINYANYFWVGLQIRDDIPGNPNVEPEHYVIKNPLPTDLIKQPVRLATTEQISLYSTGRAPETFILTFVTSTTFTITSDLGPITASFYDILPGDGNETQIVISAGGTFISKFLVTNGSIPFSPGDFFEIKIKHQTSEIYVNFNSLVLFGKGTVTAVETMLPLLKIDGIEIKKDDLILVKNQTLEHENGIYVVSIGNKWQRLPNFSQSSHVNIGTKVFVKDGLTNKDKLFTVTALGNGVDTFELDNSMNNRGLIIFDSGISALNPVNDWQQANWWVHRDDFEALGVYPSVDFNTAVQATRPIIEYDYSIKLNSAYDSTGTPIDSGTIVGPYIQRKLKVNQIPQFDLFYYDGTHAGVTSGIFFFMEDPDFGVDSILKRRVKLTPDADYVFGTGLQDSDGRFLYYKLNGQLRGEWQAGVTSPTVISLKFTGGADRGDLIGNLSEISDNQDWEIKCLTPTTFSVIGSRSGYVGDVTLNVPFTSDDFSHLLIQPGITPFEVGEKFTFKVIAPLSPRYVKKLQPSGDIVNYPGGPVGDRIDNAELTGAWLCPARVFQNLERSTRTEITFGDLINHLRSVVRHQDGFEGTSFGSNNLRYLPTFNPGFGGSIREFSSNFPLLASLLIQQGISPLSIIDFMEQQQSIALSSIDQFIINEMPTFLATKGVVATSAIDPLSPEISLLLAEFEKQRAENSILQMTFGDTTAKVACWPASLPMLGLIPAIEPGIIFDHELGIFIIIHHDGHSSPIATNNSDFDRQLISTVVLRSDGTRSPGTFSETPPALPYAGHLWLKPTTGEIKIFDVKFDNLTAPISGEPNDWWFNRTTGQLYQRDSSGLSWVLSTATILSRWVPFDAASIRNSLLLAIEQKLYESVHPHQQLNINLLDVNNSRLALLEFTRYAAKNDYDMFRGDYEAANAFTWNYSNAIIPGVSQTPARWFDVYRAYFDNASGCLPTIRPNLEPWRLLGYLDKPSSWDSIYLSTNPGSTNEVVAKTVILTNVSALAGLPTNDGMSLASGDRVLLVGQALKQQNGLYVVNTGLWTRTTDSLINQLTIKIIDGNQFNKTRWSITTVGGIIPGTTLIDIEQVRTWKQQMWVDIKTARPTLKLCVNTSTDELIAPYVSPLLWESSEALLTVIPSGITTDYEFGDNGPVETVWKKSMEYMYGLLRSYFRLFPLKFLDKTWGETYVQAGSNNVRVERNLQTSLPASKFLLHGERLNLINSYTSTEVKRRVKVVDENNRNDSIAWIGAGIVKLEVTHCADNITVFTVSVNDVEIGNVFEGTPFSISPIDGIELVDVTIDDMGIPFELGDKIIITFYDDTVTYDEVDDDYFCEGCFTTEKQRVEISRVRNEPTYAHSPAIVKTFKGICQWFTNLLRFNNVDTELSDAISAYRGWDIKLAHRLGALINQDTFTMTSSHGLLPTTAYAISLKRSAKINGSWYFGLRVQLLQMGANKKFNQFGLIVPSDDAGDWVFRIENYNTQHPYIDRYVLDTAGTYQTFNAISKERNPREWKRYYNHTSLLKDDPLPQTITGLQNVCNFIYGYVDRLEELGWASDGDSPTIDPQTGRNLDWQLEVEKLIDMVYAGMSAGQGHILNPLLERAVLNTPVGIMSRYTRSNFSDIYSTQACYDVLGAIIPIDSLEVIRTDERCITKSKTPIYSSHVFVDEFEHVVLLNKKLSDESGAALIFDQFLGVSIDSAYLNYIQQEESFRKPTFNGFFLSGQEVKRNVVASITNMGNFYDSRQSFNDELTSKHAMALLGFTKKDYFADIRTTGAGEFNFWLGLIQAKGTNMAVDAFTNYKKFENASVDEYWAYKLATFGDARERTLPEIRLTTGDVTQRYSRFQFYSQGDSHDVLPLYTQIESSDDERWLDINDLGKGLTFDASEISETINVSVPNSIGISLKITATNIFGSEEAVTDPIIIIGDFPTTVEVSATSPSRDTPPSGLTVSISGTPTVGSTFTASYALENYGIPMILSPTFQWKQNGVNINGATGQTYVIVEDNEGRTISVEATVSNAHGSVSSQSNSILISNTTPFGLTVPIISSSKLIATHTLSKQGDSPVSITYQWKRDGVDISGATSSTYDTTPADDDKNITVAITAGTASAISPVSNAIPYGLNASISGTLTVGSILTVSHTLALHGINTGISYQWKQDGVDIDGQTASTYEVVDVDVGKEISVELTANSGEVVVASAPVLITTAAPVGLTVTNIQGSTLIGSTLKIYYTLQNPGIPSENLSISYQWKRNGVSIDGATSSTYAFDTADIGNEITVTVIASNSTGTITATSAALTSAPAGLTALSISSDDDAFEIGSDLKAKYKLTNVGYPAANVSYQWKRNGSNITGATSSSYSVVAADANATITVVITATNVHGTVTATSSGLSKIPTELTAFISGTPSIGAMLYARYKLVNHGTPPTDMLYQWKRNGTNIVGAVASTYVFTAIDEGKDITVTVTAQNAAGSIAATSELVKTPTAIPDGLSASISGSAKIGSTLKAEYALRNQGVPSATITYQWTQDGIDIEGETASTYVVKDDDLGKDIGVTVTAMNLHGRDIAASTDLPIAAIAPTGLTVFVSGIRAAGHELIANHALINEGNSAASITYQWKRNGTNIVGATSSTYEVDEIDEGANITVNVVATNSTGSVNVTSSNIMIPTIVPEGLTASIIGALELVANPSLSNPGSPVATYTYQWLRNGIPISEATDATYMVVLDDLGTEIMVKARASNLVGYVEATSSPSIIFGGPDAPPVNLIVSIVGVPTIGSILTANHTLVRAGMPPVNFSYQWKRNGINIVGATLATYTTVIDDVDVGITVMVTAANSAGETSTTSPTFIMGRKVLGLTATITGSPVVGKTLTVNHALIEPGSPPAAYTYQWLRNGIPITGAVNQSYVITKDDLGDGKYVKLKNIFYNDEIVIPKVSRIERETIGGNERIIKISDLPGASMVGADIIKVMQSGEYLISGFTWINKTKLSPVKLLNYKKNEIIEEIGLWHPAIGIHAYSPLELINIISATDPSQYNYTTKTTNNPNYLRIKPWAEKEVGRIWWDTSNLGYVPYYDAAIFPNRTARESRWGALAEWATIDLYEWIMSSVPPTEYDEKAELEEGNYQLDPRVRASGRAALKKHYARERIIKMRPIAWSYTPSHNADAHPAFGSAEHTTTYSTNDSIVSERGTVAKLGLTAGIHFGAWKDGMPVGEVELTDQLDYLIGSSDNLTEALIIPGPIASGVIDSISLEPIDGNNAFGSRLGKITFRDLSNPAIGIYKIRCYDSSENYQDVEINDDWYSDDLESDSVKIIDFDQFGLRMKIRRGTTGNIINGDIVKSVINPNNDIVIRESIRFNTIIPLPANTFINDEFDPLYLTTEYEWRAWSVPSQTELDEDLAFPRNSWQPYIGKLVTVNASTDLIKQMEQPASILTLKNGIKIHRFDISWTDWVALSAIKQEIISNGVTYIEFTLPGIIDINRLSLYINGIQLNPESYAITEIFDAFGTRQTVIQVTSVLPEGHTCMLLYRHYQPSANELEFNPEIDDDFSIQVQYKLDYQYTKLDIRDEHGNISGSRYYFWVRDKMIPSARTKMSLEQATTILRDGGDNYMIFSRLNETEKSFDSCAIVGLGRHVSQNDAFKLRFIRDFTLRDDPEELNLKNVHTEWELIFKNQLSKIPRQLWSKLIDAACGEDAGGNQLPAQNRINYDKRNGTRARFGFGIGQILADTNLVKKSIIHSIINLPQIIRVGGVNYLSYNTALGLGEKPDIGAIEQILSDPKTTREMLNAIWNNSTAQQVNQLFFDVLDDVLVENYELTDLFKTSYVRLNSQTIVEQIRVEEQVNAIY